MNKNQLIDAVAESTGNRGQAAKSVELVLDTIVRAVTAGQTVSVTGFGTLTPQHRPERTARNPRNGTAVTVAATRAIKFRPGSRFRDLVAGRTPMPATGNSIKKAPKTPRP
ncbi:HU family DNA-binding protein [Streptomyces fractus]|uniref:HU family DNA-binding protein n=1 Tax=Streptomyces fractus TaxID=641806 RepID=UPI003CE80A21